MNLHPYTLLLAEDSNTCAENVMTLLSPLYQLDRVGTGIEALQSLLNKAYDLVLLNTDLSGLSGIEVCRAAKADPVAALVPVIFMTATRDDELLSACFEAGGIDYLIKPLHDHELLSRISCHLRVQELERALHRQIEMRNLMLLSLSHDVRGSIGSVIGLMDLIGQEGLSEADRRLFQGATRAARHSYQFLEDTLTWTQALDQQLAFQPVWLSFALFAQECLDQVRPNALQKGLALVMDAEPGLRVYADRRLLKTLLHNLLSNAIKFTAQGGVTLRAAASETGILLEVADTGRGLPADVLARLERGQPITSQSGTQGERGTGMGLKICQALAAYHATRLQLRPNPGQGTLISMLLPFPADGLTPPEPGASE